MMYSYGTQGIKSTSPVVLMLVLSHDMDSDEDDTEVMGGEKVLKKAYLRFVEHETASKCPFLYVVRTENAISRQHSCDKIGKSVRL